MSHERIRGQDKLDSFLSFFLFFFFFEFFPKDAKFEKTLCFSSVDWTEKAETNDPRSTSMLERSFSSASLSCSQTKEIQ